MATSVNNIDYNAVQRAFEIYYLSEDHEIAGRGDFIQGSIFSKGRGFGSIIRAVVKAATPLLKKAGRALKPLAKQSGEYLLHKGIGTVADITTDMISGVPPKEAIQNNGEIFIESAKSDTIHGINNFKNQVQKRINKGPLKRKRHFHKASKVSNINRNF